MCSIRFVLIVAACAPESSKLTVLITFRLSIIWGCRLGNLEEMKRDMETFILMLRCYFNTFYILYHGNRMLSELYRIVFVILSLICHLFPSMRHRTLAALSSNKYRHIVPHSAPLVTSTRPLESVGPSSSRTCIRSPSENTIT